MEYHLARDHALFGDAPGVGKTPECVMLGNAIEARRTLCVVPASLRYNWEREIWRWSTTPNVGTYVIESARDGVSPDAHYNIISYDLLRNAHILEAILSVRWDHLILDEAHYLKSPKGNKRTHAICAPDGVSSVVGRMTMASGTLLPNQPIECYNAVRLLDWDAIDRMSLERFRDYYYGKGSGFVTGPYMARNKKGDMVRKHGPHWATNVRNVPRNLDELRLRLRKHVMIRRLKADVLPELPPRNWNVVPLATTLGMKKAMQHPGWGEVKNLFELDPDGFAAGVPVDGHISQARRLLGEEKIDATADYVLELLLEGREKLVVGAWHLSVLAGLKRRLNAMKLSYVYMDGATGPKEKQRVVDQFQDDPEVRVALGQMMPLGEGWTLTAAEDVVMPEPYWVPGKNDQLLDRVHRIGQTGSAVTGHVLVVPNTLDEQIMSRVVEKDRVIYTVLDKED